MLKLLHSQESGIVAGGYRGIPSGCGHLLLGEATEDLRLGDPVPSCDLHLTQCFAVWARSLHIS